jgi:5-methylcytosine-specific restriction endonuclease McrA
MKTKRAKACDISAQVKDRVWARDGHQCIICHSVFAFPNSHFIRRSKGGLGIEENVVTMCLVCHQMYDQGIDRKAMEKRVESYLKSKYPNWDKKKLVYRKGE